MTQNKSEENAGCVRVIGLTGNTGSGKSSVAAILSECGGFIIDADKIAHKVLSENKNVLADIAGYFGDEVLDFTEKTPDTDGVPGRCINRKKLGAIVFSDPIKKKILEDITHKYILKEITGLIDKIKSQPGSYKFIVMDAALLTESNLHKKADEVWVVYAPDALRKSRIIARDSLTEKQAADRMASQTEFSKLRSYADRVIENTGDYAQLEQTVKCLICEID